MTQKQRILGVLADGRWHSAAELYRTGCVLHSRISDLRNKDGYLIERRNVGGTGAEAHEYRLLDAEEVRDSPAVPATVPTRPGPSASSSPVTAAAGEPSTGAALDSHGQMRLVGEAFRKRHAA